MDALLEKVRARALGPGTPDVSAVRLRQRGEIRLAPDKPWLPFEADQVVRASVAEFRWTARVRMAPLVTVRVVDAYEDGRGRLDARLWGVIRLAHGSGPAIDAGELIRYLAELAWCPPAYVLNPHLTFRSEDETHLRVAASARTGDVSVRLGVDPAGDVVEAYATDRPRLVGKAYVPTGWRGAFSEHRSLAGMRIPTRGVVTWHLDDGPFECFRGTVTDLRLERGSP